MPAQGLLAPVTATLRAVSAAVANVNGAPVRLSPLTITNAFGDWNTLLQPVLSHYTRQALTQVLKVLPAALASARRQARLTAALRRPLGARLRGRPRQPREPAHQPW
jgi:hypothetical protein